MPHHSMQPLKRFSKTSKRLRLPQIPAEYAKYVERDRFLMSYADVLQTSILPILHGIAQLGVEVMAEALVEFCITTKVGSKQLYFTI